MLGQTDEDCSSHVQTAVACGNVLKHTYCDMPILYMLINQSELTLG